jgi:hypothetical protein
MAPPKRRSKKAKPLPPPAGPVVRPVLLDALQLHDLSKAVDAYYHREYVSWLEKGYDERWAADWSAAVTEPSRHALARLVEAFDGAFD